VVLGGQENKRSLSEWLKAFLKSNLHNWGLRCCLSEALTSPLLRTPDQLSSVRCNDFVLQPRDKTKRGSIPPLPQCARIGALRATFTLLTFRDKAWTYTLFFLRLFAIRATY
jgi:hypothetical protein